MTPERYQLINALADSALEVPHGQRGRFLDEACAGDGELRVRVEQLLAAHESSAGFLESSVLQQLAKDMAAPAARSDLIGQRVDRYSVISRLGAGGIGQVWLARDEELTRDVALKLLFPRYAGDPLQVRRFQQEARAASTLNHPNIVTIFEIGKSEGVDFIAQELVQGQTLRQWLANGPVPMHSVLAVGVQIAAALEAAHGAGIVHRDIKPENVMVRPDGLVKVLDFGLARFIESGPLAPEASRSKESITQPGFVLGTVRYMSPEQARGLPVDQRSDLFSLGVVLYEMLTGSAPFSGSTPSDVLAAILTHEPAPLSTGLPGLPLQLELIIHRCLEKDPQLRYPGANELRQDLELLRRRIGLSSELVRSDAPSISTNRRLKVSKARGAETVTAGAGTLRSQRLVLPIGILALMAAVGIFFYAGRRPIISSLNSMKISRLSTRGEVADAAISADGKYVSFVLDEERGQSLWITQLATGTDVRTLGPEAGQHTGLIFSANGNYLYYRKRVNNGIFNLYRVRVPGGQPVELMANVAGIAFAPSGKNLAFFRVEPSNKESTLMIANPDGTEQRRIATRRLPRYYSRYSLAWSPDGRWIACFAGDAVSSTARAFHLIKVRVADGAERTITDRAWRWGGSIVWPASDDALLFDATDQIDGEYQIWTASLHNGSVSRLTNDLNDYTRLSLTSDAKSMLALQTQKTADLWVAPSGDSARAVQMSFGNVQDPESIAWTPDGRIVYSSQLGDYHHISIMDTDGRDSRQITRGTSNEIELAVTRDGKYVVYQSEGKIRRIDIDGANAVQLTHGAMDVHADPSADSRSIVYASFTDWSPGIAGKPTLWRVPIEGGKPVQLSPDPASIPKVSPDGKLVTFKYFPDADPQLSPHGIAIMSFDGGAPLQTSIDCLRLPVTCSGRPMGRRFNSRFSAGG